MIVLLEMEFASMYSGVLLPYPILDGSSTNTRRDIVVQETSRFSKLTWKVRDVGHHTYDKQLLSTEQGKLASPLETYTRISTSLSGKRQC